MSSKRPLSRPRFIPNPLIKERNLSWTLETTPNDTEQVPDTPSKEPTTCPTTTAQVESGDAAVPDHASSHFANTLAAHAMPSIPKIPISAYQALYDANAGSLRGSHFVIHQHDHPIAGTHYDLRLQINETSSVSWAIMYGLPGNVNSTRQNRNATETRIHCLWNHLIETASSATGSLLIWDTGTYTILPRKSKHDPEIDPSSPPSSPPSASPKTQQELLHEAFQNRKIRLRLHGAKLPDPYVINLRLTKSEDASGRAKSARSLASGRKRRRRSGGGRAAAEVPLEETTDEEEDTDIVPSNGEQPQKPEDTENVSAMERELRELEDDHVRQTNAYSGASNTIGSVHQRRWYLSLDRPACGLVESNKKAWRSSIVETKDSVARKENQTIGAGILRSAYPFFVRGADHERSVVTGRLGQDILQDEGVVHFVRRKGWKPVLN